MKLPLNFFAPYQSLAGHHENQLTRALLVVLRYSPLAHMTWLRFVDPALQLEGLPPARFRTQEGRLLASKKRRMDDEAAIRGISVLLEPDPKQRHGTVAASDRRQILDGIIQYGDDLVIAIENKILSGVKTRQPSAINTGGAVVVLDRQVRTVAWQALLEALADLSIRGLVTGSERHVIDDFLEFTEHHFPQVGPYSTLRRAGQSRARIKRRLDAVLASAIGVAEMTRQELGSRHLPERADGLQRCVEMAFLQMDRSGGRILLRLYPGDTLTQAKVLYRRAEAVRGLLALPRWTVRTNYHWGFRTSGSCWSRGDILPDSYIAHWTGRIGRTRALPREQWDAGWTNLEALGIVRPDDRAEFDLRFTNTKIPWATPRPGLECEYAWSLDEAMRLDDSGHFVGKVREAIMSFLQQLGEPLPLPQESA